MRPAIVLELCPTCRTTYTAGLSPDPSGKGRRGKHCPLGHWFPLHQLQSMREKGRVPVLRRSRRVGVIGELETLRLSLTSMVSAYDQTLRTLPEGTVPRLIVEGAFEKVIHLAREVLK